MIKAELLHHKDLNLQGNSFNRQAVRALIYNGNEVLFIYSPVNGDYKLPGGGIENGEDHESALKREVLEECGYTLSKISEKIGLITEYSEAMEKDKAFFQMDSHYYTCKISDQKQVKQNLDDYEKDLKMKPVWIIPQEALKKNQNIIIENSPPPKWIKREILFLEYLLQKNRTQY
ncbi:MAG: NUDIX domain-containing protein [Spirochaetaceae bacterium]|nr:NUDIX domain-containing protein [Spirochaetaceae bacterium]